MWVCPDMGYAAMLYPNLKNVWQWFIKNMRLQQFNPMDFAVIFGNTAMQQPPSARESFAIQVLRVTNWSPGVITTFGGTDAAKQQKSYSCKSLESPSLPIKMRSFACETPQYATMLPVFGQISPWIVSITLSKVFFGSTSDHCWRWKIRAMRKFLQMMIIMIISWNFGPDVNLMPGLNHRYV